MTTPTKMWELGRSWRSWSGEAEEKKKKKNGVVSLTLRFMKTLTVNYFLHSFTQTQQTLSQLPFELKKKFFAQTVASVSKKRHNTPLQAEINFIEMNLLGLIHQVSSNCTKKDKL